MAWVAFDRAVKTRRAVRMDGPVERWRALRARIHDDVCRDGFNPALGAFVQCYGAEALDASLLLIPLVGFLPPQRSARAQHRRGDRARADRRRPGAALSTRETGIDGLPPGEGVFLPCSFWLADNLVLLGRRDEARGLVRAAAVACATMSGCCPRNTTSSDKRLVGNFPQAFSHVALINTAHYLTSQRPAHYSRHAAELQPHAAQQRERHNRHAVFRASAPKSSSPT